MRARVKPPYTEPSSPLIKSCIIPVESPYKETVAHVSSVNAQNLQQNGSHSRFCFCRDLVSCLMELVPLVLKRCAYVSNQCPPTVTKPFQGLGRRLYSCRKYAMQKTCRCSGVGFWPRPLQTADAINHEFPKTPWCSASAVVRSLRLQA